MSIALKVDIANWLVDAGVANKADFYNDDQSDKLALREEACKSLFIGHGTYQLLQFVHAKLGKPLVLPVRGEGLHDSAALRVSNW